LIPVHQVPPAPPAADDPPSKYSLRIRAMTLLNQRAPAVLPALWPASVGALAILYANAGGGAWARRSTIAWMMGSWGARLTVQALYTRRSVLPLRTSNFVVLTSALALSTPALFASRNPAPSLSSVEIGAAVLWLIAFAGQTTADRKGLQRIPHAHAICEALIWTAFALFASASPWGWTAFACLAARIYLLTRRC
jgi:steroid 5-alpha reductase family enzyme